MTAPARPRNAAATLSTKHRRPHTPYPPGPPAPLAAPNPAACKRQATQPPPEASPRPRPHPYSPVRRLAARTYESHDAGVLAKVCQRRDLLEHRSQLALAAARLAARLAASAHAAAAKTVASRAGRRHQLLPRALRE
jgi:hypothetical protein